MKTGKKKKQSRKPQTREPVLDFLAEIQTKGHLVGPTPFWIPKHHTT
jgi:hypothetical protein